MKGTYNEQSPGQINLENKEHTCQDKSQVNPMPAGRLNYTNGVVWRLLERLWHQNYFYKNSKKLSALFIFMLSGIYSGALQRLTDKRSCNRFNAETDMRI